MKQPNTDQRRYGVLAVACVLGRMALEQLDPAAGEACRRGSEVLTGALTGGVLRRI